MHATGGTTQMKGDNSLALLLHGIKQAWIFNLYKAIDKLKDKGAPTSSPAHLFTFQGEVNAMSIACLSIDSLLSQQQD